MSFDKKTEVAGSPSDYDDEDFEEEIEVNRMNPRSEIKEQIFGNELQDDDEEEFKVQENKKMVEVSENEDDNPFENDNDTFNNINPFRSSQSRERRRSSFTNWFKRG